MQGAYVDGEELWFGVSRPKRWLLFQAALQLVSRRAVRSRCMQRFVGKCSFAQSFRVASRSLFSAIYDWIQLCVDKNISGSFLWPQVRSENVGMIALLPFLECDLAAQF